MEIEVDLTKDDVVAFNLYHIAHSPTVRRQKLFLACVGCAVLLMVPGLVTALSERPTETVFDIWPLWLVVPVFILLVLFRSPQRHRKTIKRLLDEGKNAYFFGKRVFHLTPSGITESGPSGESTKRWQAIEKVVITDTAVYLYSSSLTAFIIPRRAFADETSLKAFITAVQDYRNAAARTAPPGELRST